MNNNQHKVLLVEPSSTQARIITRLLNECGFSSVTHKKNAQEAIDCCQEIRPSIILSAFYLRDMHADKFAIDLFHSDECGQTLFILISSEYHHKFLEPIRQSGIHSILPKPFLQNQLQSVLQQAVEYIELRDSIGRWLPKDFSVLITDDSSLSRKYISNSLNKLGIRNIFEASNVDTAIRIMDKNMISLIISDYTMPAKSGMNLLEYIRKESLQPGIPFILVSANINHRIIKQAYENGITNILAKPFSFKEFKKIMEDLVSENKS